MIFYQFDGIVEQPLDIYTSKISFWKYFKKILSKLDLHSVRADAKKRFIVKTDEKGYNHEYNKDMSYSKDYRKRTIEYRQAGYSLEATHQVFKVSKSTIQKWEKQLKETGDLDKKELHRSFRKIDPEKLKMYVAQHPEAYQSEMAPSAAD